MNQIPDHPDVAAALATGYPRGYREPTALTCQGCGCTLEGSDKVYIFDGDELCEDCCAKRISDNFDTVEIASALGAVIRLAYECARDDVEDYV